MENSPEFVSSLVSVGERRALWPARKFPRMRIGHKIVGRSIWIWNHMWLWSVITQKLIQSLLFFITFLFKLPWVKEGKIILSRKEVVRENDTPKRPDERPHRHKAEKSQWGLIPQLLWASVKSPPSIYLEGNLKVDGRLHYVGDAKNSKILVPTSLLD